MLVDVSQVLARFDGQPLMDVDEGGAVVTATVSRALVNAALAPNQKDSGVQKIQKYELAKKIYTANGPVELSPEEVVMLKRQVEEVYPPLVCGQLCAMLDGK